MKDCKYYCKDYQLEGVCKKHSDWSEAMPTIEYCLLGPCGDYEEEKLPTYDELYEHWLKTKDRPNRKRKMEPLPGQISLFDTKE